MDTINQYDNFLALLKSRRSIRKFKPDPIPEEDVMKILEAAHLAMSGANSQPWVIIVIKDPEIKKKIFTAYIDYRDDNWHFEQQRVSKYRHPAFNLPPEDKDKSQRMLAGWGSAPVYFAVLQDPRKQFGSVLYAQGSFTSKDVLSATMGHFSMTIHLAAASLGLGSQRVDISEQSKYREILGYPEPLFLETIVPVGYRAYELGPPRRLPLEELVHYDTYDMEKHLHFKDFLEYLERIRELGREGYFVAIGEK